MGADQHHDWHGLAASALDWWREAGVDVLVEDEARDWLAAPAAPQAAAIVAAVAERETRPPPPLPDTLDAFLAWRIGEDAPDAGRGTPVAPEGNPASEIMVIVECPGEDGLLDGDSARLFDRMLAAIGRTRADVHLASLTTYRPITGRVASDMEAQLAPVIRQHVALSSAKVVLALGAAVNRALGGTDARPGEGNLHAVNLNGRSVLVVASYHPRTLLERSVMKAAAWRDLQLLMKGTAAVRDPG